LVTSDGRDVAYDYDTAGRLVKLHDATNSRSYYYDYDASGNIVHQVWSGGSNAWYAYDRANRIVGIDHYADAAMWRGQALCMTDRRGAGPASGNHAPAHQETSPRRLSPSRQRSGTPSPTNAPRRAGISGGGVGSDSAFGGGVAVYCFGVGLNQGAATWDGVEPGDSHLGRVGQ
jgi:YD repeat-containing protein